MDSDKERGAAQALHYVRRVIEKGEETRTKTLLVLLDWEKAFDNVIHEIIRSIISHELSRQIHKSHQGTIQTTNLQGSYGGQGVNMDTTTNRH